MTRVDPPTLPVTWRPRRGRMVPYGFAGAIVSGTVIFALVLPPQFKVPDRIGVLLFGLAVAFVLHLLGRCRVSADGDGVTVVNALRTHRYTWPEVIDVHMARGEPWPKLDLADGSTIGAMGIQGSEKERARQAVGELLALIHRHGEAAEPR